MFKWKEYMSYSVRDASEILGLSPGIIRKYCRENRIPCFKIGNRYRIAYDTIVNIRNGTIIIK